MFLKNGLRSLELTLCACSSLYQYCHHSVDCDFVIIKLEILILFSFIHILKFIHLVLSNFLSIILNGFPNKLYLQQFILPTLANVLDELTANKKNSMCLRLLICTSKSNIVHSFFTCILSEINHFLGVKIKHVHPRQGSCSIMITS